MKILNKIICVLLVLSVFISVFCLTSSASIYLTDDDDLTARHFNIPFTQTFKGVMSSNVNAVYSSSVADLRFEPGIDYSGLGNLSGTNFEPNYTDYTPNFSRSKLVVEGYNSIVIGDGVDSYSDWYSKSVDFDYVTRCIGSGEYYTFQGYHDWYLRSDAKNHLSTLVNGSVLSSDRNNFYSMPSYSYDGVIDISLLRDHLNLLPSHAFATVVTDADSSTIDGSDSLDFSNLIVPSGIDYSFTFSYVSDNGEWIESTTSSFIRSDATPYYVDSIAKSYVYSWNKAAGFNNFESAVNGGGINMVSYNFDLTPLYDRLFSYVDDYRMEEYYITNITFKPVIIYNLQNSNDVFYNNSYIKQFCDRWGTVPCFGNGLSYRDVNSFDISYADACSFLEGEYNDDRLIVNIIEEKVSLSDFSLVDWLGNTLGRVMNIDIIGTISFNDILLVCAGLGLLFFVLKMFVGG